MTQQAQPALSTDSQVRLAAWLPQALAADSVAIRSAEKLAGGAVQENWRLDVVVSGGTRAGQHSWVLRTDSPARLSMSLDRIQEFACLRVAHAAGVRVAEPIIHCADLAIIGRPFLIQDRLEGTAQGRRLVRDPALKDFGDVLAREIGQQMALLHTIVPPRAELPFLTVPGAPASAVVRQIRGMLDACTQPRPALEYILCWLEAKAPPARQVVLVHGDLRTGNVMVDHGRMTGILDWEFCHWGDPREDIGWFCARCWRFGNDALEAGGLAAKSALLEGYNARASHPVTAAEVDYWEVMAAARWAAIAALQGDRFLKSGERSLELALTGLMPAEMEVDALELIAAQRAGA